MAMAGPCAESQHLTDICHWPILKIRRDLMLKGIVLAAASLLIAAEGLAADINCSALPQVRKQAEQGDSVAQGVLGVVYDSGDCVGRDYAKAAEWFRKAAEQGEENAQLLLGIKYLRGQGVPQDFAEAARWLQMVADKGDVAAQSFLGLMYAQGLGIEKDLDRARTLFAEACKNGDVDSCGYLKEY